MAQSFTHISNVNPIRGTGPLLSLNAATSAGVGITYTFDQPLTQWGLQVTATSTTAVVLLQGSVATSSGATLTTLLTWGSSDYTSGTTIWGTGKAALQAGANLSAGASSAITAWFCGAP